MVFEGIPVLIKERERPPRTIRIRYKKPGRKALEDLPFSKLDSRQKQALSNYVALGCDPKRKKEAAEAAGYSDALGGAVRAMDKILARLPILKELEEQCVARYNKEADAKAAEIILDGFEAIHPLAKEKRTDNSARLNSVKEYNKIKGNYPAKKIDVREMGVHLVFGAAEIKAAKEYRELTKDDEDS